MDKSNENEIVINDTWFNINSCNDIQIIKNNQTLILNEINLLKQLITKTKQIADVSTQTSNDEVFSEVQLTSKEVFKQSQGNTEGVFKNLYKQNNNLSLGNLDENIILDERKKNLLIRSKIPFHFYSNSLNPLTNISAFKNIEVDESKFPPVIL